MAEKKIVFDDVKDSCSALTKLAGNVNDTITACESAVGDIENPAWEGKASSAYRDALTKLLDHLPNAKQQLALSVVFLASCADAYESLGKDSIKALKELIGGQDYIDKYNVDGAPIIDLDSRYGKTSESKTKSKEETDSSNDNDWTSLAGNSSSGSYSGGSRYTYSTGGGGSSGGGGGSTSGVATTALVSAATTTGTIQDLVQTDLTGKKIAPRDGIKQGAYTVTGYDYWIDSGKEMTWMAGTNQRKVSDLWKEQGSVFKNGIAVINVDGVDRYLIAVTTKYGQPGDCIDVVLEDGTVIPCIIGDSKGSDAGDVDGHVLSDGSINILEFEVQRSKYLQSGNPTTEKWGLPWDSSKKVAYMENKGSIIGAKVVKGATATQLANTTEPATATEAREAIVKVAESQLNNTNEKEYVAMFGESNGTPWCSEFVSWCAKKSGYTDAGIIPKFADAPSGVKWFKNNNQFQDRNYTPKAGDIIFVGGSEPSHTALVTGVKDGKIQTIDGNKGDKVLRSSYKLGSSSIYGFGTPDYSKLVKSSEAVTV